MFYPHQVTISEAQKRKLQKLIKRGSKVKPVVLRLKNKELDGEHTLLLTQNQLKKLERARRFKHGVTIKMSSRQVKVNTRAEGGFLSILASLASKVLPTILGGLATGLVSAGVEKAVKGHGVFLNKKGHYYRVEPVEGNGLYLSPHPQLDGIDGDGLYIRSPDGAIRDGKGLLLGENSPFKNIPILGLIL